MGIKSPGFSRGGGGRTPPNHLVGPHTLYPSDCGYPRRAPRSVGIGAAASLMRPTPPLLYSDGLLFPCWVSGSFVLVPSAIKSTPYLLPVFVVCVGRCCAVASSAHSVGSLCIVALSLVMATLHGARHNIYVQSCGTT